MGKLIRDITKKCFFVLAFAFIAAAITPCQEKIIYNAENSPLTISKITCISVDSSNNIWVGAVGGIYHFFENSWTKLDTALGIHNASEYEPFVSDIETAPNGNVWFGIAKSFAQDLALKQLGYFANGKIYTVPFSLSSLGKYPGKLFIGNDNTIYLPLWNTWQQGVAYEINLVGIIKNDQLNILNQSDTNVVWGIDYVVPLNGDSLLCYDWEGIHMFNGSTYKLINPDGWIPKGIAKKGNGMFVFGEKLESYSSGTYQSYPKIDSLLSSDSLSVTCIGRSNENVLWLGTDRGYLIKYSDSKIKKFLIESKEITDIAIDKDENIWLLIPTVGCIEFNENRITNICQTDNISIPHEFVLYQNYPNPFNPTTTITYQLPRDGYVTLKVYDILGREVVSLVNANKKAGSYSCNFDAGNLCSGVYIYKLTAGELVQSKKMILMK
jgi:hypothetical protein